MDESLIPLFIGALALLIAILPAFLLYVIPVRIVIAYTRDDRTDESTVTLSWACAGIRIARAGSSQELSVLMADHTVWSGKGGERVRHDNADTRPAGPAVSVVDILRSTLGVIGPAGRLVLVIWRLSWIDEIRGNARIGLDNPASTGMLYGGYWASRFAMNAARIYIDLVPEFNRPVIEVDIAMSMRVKHPLLIITQGIEILREPGVRESLAAFRPAGTGASGA